MHKEFVHTIVSPKEGWRMSIHLLSGCRPCDFHVTSKNNFELGISKRDMKWESGKHGVHSLPQAFWCHSPCRTGDGHFKCIFVWVTLIGAEAGQTKVKNLDITSYYAYCSTKIKQHREKHHVVSESNLLWHNLLNHEVSLLLLAYHQSQYFLVSSL